MSPRTALLLAACALLALAAPACGTHTANGSADMLTFGRNKDAVTLDPAVAFDGISLTAARPIFEQWIAPLRDLGVTMLAPRARTPPSQTVDSVSVAPSRTRLPSGIANWTTDTSRRHRAGSGRIRRAQPSRYPLDAADV